MKSPDYIVYRGCRLGWGWCAWGGLVHRTIMNRWSTAGVLKPQTMPTKGLRQWHVHCIWSCVWIFLQPLAVNAFSELNY